MGIDAEIRVLTPAPLGDQDIMNLSVAACDAFGQGFFFIDRERRQAAIERWEPKEWEEVPKPGHWLTVNTLMRYYSEGYARGPIIEFLALAEWFEHRIPGCEVYYGGDNTDFLEPFTPERRAELFRFFAEHGHSTYRGRSLNPEPPPECDWCRVPMRGGTYHGTFATTYHCIHCKHEVKVEHTVIGTGR